MNPKFQIPPWSQPFQGKLSLQAIKNGFTVQNHAITAQTTFLGKDSANHLVMLHPTISRQHAVLQTNKSKIFILDLASSHGTFVNNSKIQPFIFHQLHNFDQIRFAQSSRNYVMLINEGKTQNFIEQLKQSSQLSNLSPQQLKQYYMKLVRQCKGLTKRSLNSLKENKVEFDWGFSNDQEVYRYAQKHDYQLSVELLDRLPNLSQDQQRVIERYRESMNKYNRLQVVLNNLLNHRRGQSNSRIDNLNAELYQLSQHIQNIENQLRLKLFNDRPAEEVSRTLLIQEIDKGMNDQTQQIQHDVFTTQDFRQLVMRLEELRRKETGLLKQAESFCNTIFQTEEDDQLQKFMMDNQIKVKDQSKAVLLKQIESVQGQIARTIRLLQLKAPKTPRPSTDLQPPQPQTIKVKAVSQKIKQLRIQNQQPKNSLQLLKFQSEIIKRQRHQQQSDIIDQQILQITRQEQPEKRKMRSTVTLRPESRDHKEFKGEREFVDLTQFQ